MAASKRDFKNFHDFPGTIDEGTGFHTFPALWRLDSMDRVRIYVISVRLIKFTGQPINSIDWNLLQEVQVPIKPDYYAVGSRIPQGNYAQAWVETGIHGGKITRSAPTYFTTVALEGQANERNVFQQALIYARSQWLKRKETGSTEEDLSKVSNTSATSAKSASSTSNTTTKATSKDTSTSSATASKSAKSATNTVLYFPMLAVDYKTGEKHLQFPLYVQPKLDGVRCLSFLSKPDSGPEHVIIYSRTKKLFPAMEYLKEELYPYLNSLYDHEKNQSIYLDGELYKHGKKLQDISGESRNSAVADTTTNRNEYHIYDCFYPLELEIDFDNRLKQLQNLYDCLTSKKIIKPVPYKVANNITEVKQFYKNFLSLGYEGAILRNYDGVYLTSSSKTGQFLRSKNLVKMKEKFTDEFQVIGFTDGKRGKDADAIIWICQTEAGVKFNVTPKDITYDERKRLFADAKVNFAKKYELQMLTVEYEDLSKNGVPLRAKALTFRNYE